MVRIISSIAVAIFFMLLWLQAVEVGVSGGVADEEDVVDGEELMAVTLELVGQMDIEISDQEGVASVVDMASGGGSGTTDGDGGIPVVATPTVSDKQENVDEVSRADLPSLCCRSASL